MKETGALFGDVQSGAYRDDICVGPQSDGIPSQRVEGLQTMDGQVRWTNVTSLEHCVVRMNGQGRRVTVVDPSIDAPSHLGWSL